MRVSTESTPADRVPAENLLPQHADEDRKPQPNMGNALLPSPDELFERGLSYSTGQGVPQDLIQAHTYFNLAALAGNARARSMRAEVAQDMTPVEIATAQRLARQLWDTRH